MTTTKKPAAQSAPTKDAIGLLMSDHREVKAMFEKYESLVDNRTNASDRKALAETICDMLTVHTTVEEEIFYPAAREATGDDDLLNEAEVEHNAAKELIAQIRDTEPADDLYDAKVKVLGEQIDHHVKEEESELFPEVQKSGLDLRELGTRMAARKSELTAEIGESAA